MNLTEAAARLGVSSKTIRRAAEAGGINAMHPLHDAPWIFRRTDIDDPVFRQGVRPGEKAVEGLMVAFESGGDETICVGDPPES